MAQSPLLECRFNKTTHHQQSKKQTWHINKLSRGCNINTRASAETDNPSGY